MPGVIQLPQGPRAEAVMLALVGLALSVVAIVVAGASAIGLMVGGVIFTSISLLLRTHLFTPERNRKQATWLVLGFAIACIVVGAVAKQLGTMIPLAAGSTLTVAVARALDARRAGPIDLPEK